MPEPATAIIDPFWEKPTISFLCDTDAADAKTPLASDPRTIARRAEAYMRDAGIADEALMGPEFEFQVVEATTDAYPGRVFQGVIERVGNVANPVTRNFEIEARIGNPGGELRSGMITSIRILLDKRRCLVVPAAALLDERESEARVLLVSGDIARSVEVGIGSRQDRDVELLQGLAEGDEVVVYGHEQVRDGQPVTTYRQD